MPALLFALTLLEHGGALREHKAYGGSLANRLLNSNGRWSASGTASAPVLYWTDHGQAKSAAEVASLSRGRTVEVTSFAGENFGQLCAYCEHHAPALAGYLANSVAKERQIEVDRQRLMGYARVVLAGALHIEPLDRERSLQSMKLEARNLRQRGIGNGSWISAAQGLCGKNAMATFALLLDGEIACDQDLTLELVYMAISQAHTLLDI
jgi:hypothetical protein